MKLFSKKKSKATASSPAFEEESIDLNVFGKSPLEEDRKEEASEESLRRDRREVRYRKEIGMLRNSIVSQREMWEKLVKESEAQVSELRHEVGQASAERDAAKRDFEAEKLRQEARNKEFTDELVRVKMRCAELDSETQMLQHHVNLVGRRRQVTLESKRKKSVFHTCVEDDAAFDM